MTHRAKQAGHDKPARTGLARALSKFGYCSRADASKLITQGRVRLNGSIARYPEQPVLLSSDRIEVDGTRIDPARRIYLAMNKPRGIVTTARDEKQRETVYSLLPNLPGWLAPVGRLDKASEGLLFLTNDSAWAARITAPESHVKKTYQVQIEAQPDQLLLKQLLAGVSDSGELLKADTASVLRRGHKNCWVEIVLTEGKNRQIRRMFSALDITVLRLVRIAIGQIRLGDLAKGAVRELTRQEVKTFQDSRSQR